MSHWRHFTEHLILDSRVASWDASENLTIPYSTIWVYPKKAADVETLRRDLSERFPLYSSQLRVVYPRPPVSSTALDWYE